MEYLELTTTFNEVALPTAWDIENNLQSINIDSSGLKVNYTDLDDNKAAIIRANHPIPSQCGIFYFEIKVINKGKNGMIGVGYCTKQNKEIGDLFIKTDHINNILMPGQESKESELWGCGYHGDDGYSFCSGDGEPYGPTYTTDDIIGCYLNFINKIVFYTKNGVNLGIACNLPDNWKGILYPCVGFRSQGGSIEVNFGRETFKYSAMNNEDISKRLNNALSLEYQGKIYSIMGGCENVLVNLTAELTKSLEKKQNNVFELSCRGKIYFIMGQYDKALEDLTRLLEIEPNNITALKYRGEINYMMKRYNESITDLKKLLTIKPKDTWAMEAYKLVEKL
ncbi:concanavalin A-like lectin/glucanase domain-containing protein [Gigaspora rosea]|uniref:Concanavalin A-like lectin/glucanase domain-containing protein n=1 Tax=Gigaspora rosea TaxID=44941 RepID=A0A397VQU9_9GLOM|nr:concanavalin A-like lectin/glucanase domain-containing protein [Gigaspora rosea]